MASSSVMPHYEGSPYSGARRSAPVPQPISHQMPYSGNASPNRYGAVQRFPMNSTSTPIVMQQQQGGGAFQPSYQPVFGGGATAPYYNNSTALSPMPATYHYTSGMNDIGGYQPQGVTRLQFGMSPTGGMVPTYDMYAVPTFEGVLTVQTDGISRAQHTAGNFGAMGGGDAGGMMSVNQRGISMSSMGDEVSRASRSTKRMNVKTASAKPEKAGGWCC